MDSFLNAGDVFAETNVLTKVLPFTKNKEQDILYGDIFTLRGNERVIKKALEPCNKQRMFFCHQAVFVRTELMKLDILMTHVSKCRPISISLNFAI